MADITRLSFYEMSGEDVKSSYLGRCSIVLDRVIKLHGIKLFQGTGCVYITMPSTDVVSTKYREEQQVDSSSSKGSKKDLYHPVDRGYNEYLTDVIVGAYGDFLSSGIKDYDYCNDGMS